MLKCFWGGGGRRGGEKEVGVVWVIGSYVIERFCGGMLVFILFLRLLEFFIGRV